MASHLCGPDTGKANTRIQDWIIQGDSGASLDLRGMDLDTLPPLPATLRHLFCGNGPLATLSALPLALLSLTLTDCRVDTIPFLPRGLITLHCDQIPLKRIYGPFPSTLLYIHLPACPVHILAKN